MTKKPDISLLHSHAEGKFCLNTDQGCRKHLSKTRSFPEILLFSLLCCLFLPSRNDVVLQYKIMSDIWSSCTHKEAARRLVAPTVPHTAALPLLRVSRFCACLSRSLSMHADVFNAWKMYWGMNLLSTGPSPQMSPGSPVGSGSFLLLPLAQGCASGMTASRIKLGPELDQYFHYWGQALRKSAEIWRGGCTQAAQCVSWNCMGTEGIQHRTALSHTEQHRCTQSWNPRRTVLSWFFQ